MSKPFKILTNEITDLIKICSRTIGFFAVCLSHYATDIAAEFHHRLIDILEESESQLIEIIGFRGSAKTTFAALAFPLQCALTGKYKFIVLINDTGEQVKGNIYNIKTEFENNHIIKKLYPNVRLGHTWSNFNLLLEVRKPDGTLDIIRIVGRSRGQNIRGIRHKQYRPDLIIIDDPENTLQVRSKESRDATEKWFNSEVVPAARENGSKLIVIGNLLHNDGFMARLEKRILSNPELGVVIRIPFYNEDGEVAWRGKYPTQESVDRQRKKVGETAWAREYLLKVIPEEDQIILETDIQKYPNKILTERDEKGVLKHIKIKDGGVGGDLAISEKTSADFTAFVPGLKVEWNGVKLLVKPHPFKKRVNFDETLKEAFKISETMPDGTRWFVEDVGYQRAAIQQLKKRLSVYPMRPITDKRARLQSVAPFIKDGVVLFPETGCEELIQSLINFGIEPHDDDVDALVYLILGLINRKGVSLVEKFDKL